MICLLLGIDFARDLVFVRRSQYFMFWINFRAFSGLPARNRGQHQECAFEPASCSKLLCGNFNSSVQVTFSRSSILDFLSSTSKDRSTSTIRIPLLDFFTNNCKCSSSISRRSFFQLRHEFKPFIYKPFVATFSELCE
jgi:hypothetical protein